MTRPQFSIRTLLAVVIVLAISVGWIADRNRLLSQVGEARVGENEALKQFDSMAHRAAQRESEIDYLKYVANKSSR